MGKNWYLFRTLVLNNILLKIKTDLFVFSPFAGSGIYITLSGPEEIAANAYSNITLSCLVAKTVAELNDHFTGDMEFQESKWSVKNRWKV